MESFLIAAIVLWPLFILGVPALLERSRKRAWYREAQRLGLQPRGDAHRLAAFGAFRGTPVHVAHSVTYGYKQVPSFTHVVSAQLAGGATRSDVVPIEGGVITDGWLEQHGTGRIAANELERRLQSVVHLAESLRSKP